MALSDTIAAIIAAIIAIAIAGDVTHNSNKGHVVVDQYETWDQCEKQEGYAYCKDTWRINENSKTRP